MAVRRPVWRPLERIERAVMIGEDSAKLRTGKNRAISILKECDSVMIHVLGFCAHRLEVCAAVAGHVQDDVRLVDAIKVMWIGKDFSKS